MGANQGTAGDMIALFVVVTEQGDSRLRVQYTSQENPTSTPKEGIAIDLIASAIDQIVADGGGSGSFVKRAAHELRPPPENDGIVRG